MENKTNNRQHFDCGRSIPEIHGVKTIPDSVEPRLEKFYPPFVVGIDLPHQDVEDSYNLRISLLSSFNRIFEKIIAKRLIAFLDQNNILFWLAILIQEILLSNSDTFFW